MQSHPKEYVLDIIRQSRLVVIVRLADLSAAIPMSQALLAGGITALEFTLTNPAALETITKVKAALTEFADGRAVIGAGTVLDAAATQAAVEAGAQFIVSPSTNYGTIEMCQKLGVANMPGALTPTEIVGAWNAGASVVKIFPARAFGPTYLKDVLAPLPHLKLMPTGRVDLDNVGQYIKNGAFATGIGSNLVDKQLVAARDWAALKERATAYVQAVQEGSG